MQDKKPPMTDRAFTDHAWSEMRKMLDREMPVEKPARSPLAWWWVYGATGLAAALLAFYLICGIPGQPAEHPIAGQSQTESPALSEKAPELSEGQPDGSTFLAETETGLENVASRPANSPVQQKPSDKQNAGLNKEARTVTAEEFAQEKPAFAAGHDVRKKTVDREQKFAEAANETPLAEKGASIDPVAELPLDVLTIDQDPGINTGLEMPARPADLAIYTQYLGTGPDGSNGAGGGMIIELPLRKSNFSVSWGAGYQFVQQPLAISIAYNDEDIQVPGNTDPLASEVEVTYGVNDLTNMQEDFSQFNSNVHLKRSLEMHYLNVPFELTYRRGRFRVMSGMNVALLIHASPGFTTGGLLNGKSSSLDISTFEEVESSTGLQVPVSALDLGASAGIGYDISSSFGVDLKYRSGLTDIIKENSNGDFNRFFQLSLRYSILGN